MARKMIGVRERKDGTLEKRFTHNGVRYSVYGHTNKELLEKEQAKRKELDSNSYVRNKNITLNQYFEEWKERRKGKVKDSTIEQYNCVYNANIKYSLGKMQVRKIERRMILKLQSDLREKVGNSRNNLIIASLGKILNDAVKDEIITKSPCENVEKLRTDQTRKASDTIHRALTIEEQELFFKYSKDKLLHEFMAFSVCTGLRLMEVNALKWSDVDQASNVIHVTKTLTLSNGAYKETSPKTKTSCRDVPLNDTIRDVLHLQKQKNLALFGGGAIRKDSYIFRTAQGKVITSAAIKVVINSVLREIEEKEDVSIERFTHHAFRDTFATRYIENGGQMQTLKTILGHSSLSMTADLYAHVLPNTKQEEMNLIDRAFVGVV